jgi:hypothetical protein
MMQSTAGLESLAISRCAVRHFGRAHEQERERKVSDSAFQHEELTPRSRPRSSEDAAGT